MTPRRATKRQSAAALPPTVDEVELANLDALNAPPGYTSMTPTDERREREVEELVSELGSDGRIKVWSIIDGRSTYAGDMSAEGFTLDALLDAFGGGEKSLVLMQGKTKVDTFKVSLDPTIPAKNPRTPKAVAATNGAAPDMANILAAMAASQMQAAQTMTTMMTGMVSAMTAVMTATKPANDPMELALKVAELVRPAGGGSVTEAMTMFREGMQLAERYAGKDDDDGVMSVVGKGMDTLAVLVGGIVESHKAKQVAVVPAPTSTDFPGAPRGPGDTITTAPYDPTLPIEGNGVAPHLSVRPWVDAARPSIGALINASRFLSAASAAEAISNMLTDEQFNDLIDDIQDETNGGFGARLRAYFPDAINDSINAEWIGGIVQILLTEYVGDDEEEPTP